MNSPVNEWIEKAEEDCHVALTLRRLRRNPAHNAVCFHAQQCVEKYLKAILEKHGVVIRKIHALPVLFGKKNQIPESFSHKDTKPQRGACDRIMDFPL